MGNNITLDEINSNTALFDAEILERFELSTDRIKMIESEDTVTGVFKEYFDSCSNFILYVNKLAQSIYKDGLTDNIKELQIINSNLYKDILPENYQTSFANPDYCKEKFDEEVFQLLCYLYTEIRSIIPFAFEKKLYEITLYQELFIQVYNCFENTSRPDVNEIYDILYWFNYDYSDVFVKNLVDEQSNPSVSIAKDIIMNSDLNNLGYLYKYGEYISENEIKIAEYLNDQPFEKIKSMADTMSEGYRIGFVIGNKDLSKKKYASVIYAIGFERVIREVIKNLNALGLTVICYRSPMQSISRSRINPSGYYSTSPNNQFDYDHKDDIALFYDNNFAERKLDEIGKAYEDNKDYLCYYAGPAVLETFGEKPFDPVQKSTAINYDDKKRKIKVNYISKSRSLYMKYVNFEERSFTIIAFPIPEIGDRFEEIFDEIIKINTLDYNLYSRIQQSIIDVFDLCEYVEIKGCNGNSTDLTVYLTDLKNPEKETKFENCVADVNIPVGEVFTSPRLKGTSGKLFVSQVYLNGIKYNDLFVNFQDGMISDYGCSNFDTVEKQKNFIKENVLNYRDTLPMGEFAIGTNTSAYVMAKEYGIEDKLPILIAEKMGPHFAVGDTCYSHSEDVAVYNPNKKEIICRDNEITLEYRKTDPSKAYYNCHTDITIPYDELESIIAYEKDGNSHVIIKNGRFVLPGTEELNLPFNNNN